MKNYTTEEIKDILREIVREELDRRIEKVGDNLRMESLKMNPQDLERLTNEIFERHKDLFDGLAKL